MNQIFVNIGKGCCIVFWKAIFAQIKWMGKQKEAIATFYILLLLCLMNYVDNVLEFQGYDLIEMYHPMKLLLISYNRVYYKADATLFFIQLFPFLVVCPAGFSFLKERQSKQEYMIISRIGITVYHLSKVIAAYVITFIVFTVPFLLEMILNCLAFPLEATGDLTNLGFYSAEYIERVHYYSFSGLYVKAPFLYTVLCILIFGMISGLLGTVIVVFTMLFKIKYKVIVFIPVYVLLTATLYADKFLPWLHSTWYNYLLLFHDEPKNYCYFLCSVLLCLFIVVCGTFVSTKMETIK